MSDVNFVRILPVTNGSHPIVAIRTHLGFLRVDKDQEVSMDQGLATSFDPNDAKAYAKERKWLILPESAKPVTETKADFGSYVEYWDESIRYSLFIMSGRALEWTRYGGEATLWTEKEATEILACYTTREN